MFTSGFEKTAGLKDIARSGAQMVSKGIAAAREGLREGKPITKALVKKPVELATGAQRFLSERRRRVSRYLGRLGEGIREGVAEGRAGKPMPPKPGTPDFTELKGSKQLGARRAHKPTGAGLSDTQAKKFSDQQAKGEKFHSRHNPEMEGRRYMSNREQSGEAFTGDNAKRIRERAERLREFKQGKDTKPSFASKHPLATLGTGMVVGGYLMGDKKQEPQQQHVVYPQY